jgi:GntR family transcriptional regulator
LYSSEPAYNNQLPIVKAEPMPPVDPGTHDMSPLYHRIAGALRSEIATSQWPVGSKLPTIAAMASRYNVAPTTVREAFRLLTQEGLIRARRGSGTYVNELPLRRIAPVTQAGWPQLPENLRQHRGQILDADDALPPALPHEGQLAPAYRRMRRIHLDEHSEPFRVVELFVARSYYDQAPKRFDTEMALVVLEELDAAHLVEMRQSFTLTIADAEVAGHLGLRAGDPLGRLRRSLVDTSGVVAYFSIALIRSDRISLSWSMSRPKPLKPKPSGSKK